MRLLVSSTLRLLSTVSSIALLILGVAVAGVQTKIESAVTWLGALRRLDLKHQRVSSPNTLGRGSMIAPHDLK